jgi:hypothetical protein
MFRSVERLRSEVSIDNPQDAIRGWADDHALSCDKGRAAPVWPYEDVQFLRNNFAGHDHP